MATLLVSAAERFGRVLGTRSAGDFLMRLARYEPNLRTPEHCHSGVYFCLVIRGGLEERGATGEHRFEAGTAHFHGPGEPHSVRVGPRGLVSLSIIPGGGLAKRLELHSPGSGSLPSLAGWAGRCLDAFREPDEVAELAIEAAGLELVAASLRDDSSRRRAPAWVAEVRDHLDEHHARRVTLRELATLAGVHEVHVVRGFRRALGMTPGAYLRRVRLAAAHDALIRTRAPIADIALAAGFASQAHFTRLFRRETGLPPAAFRRRHGRS